MRKVLAIVIGFIIWQVIFILGQIFGYWFWDVSPSSMAPQGFVTFLSSLVGIIVAELVIKKISPTLSAKGIYIPLGCLVALSIATVFFFGGHTLEKGIIYTAVIFICAIAPLVQGLVMRPK